MKDPIERQDAIEAIRKHELVDLDEKRRWYNHGLMDAEIAILDVPPAQPEKFYTKADYIMALHKEYGCSLTRAEEAHNKALEYLQDKMMMKGGK